MRFIGTLLLFLAGIQFASAAQAEILLKTEASGIASHEIWVWTSDFARGAATDRHHHHGQEPVYVLARISHREGIGT